MYEGLLGARVSFWLVVQHNGEGEGGSSEVLNPIRQEKQASEQDRFMPEGLFSLSPLREHTWE